MNAECFSHNSKAWVALEAIKGAKTIQETAKEQERRPRLRISRALRTCLLAAVAALFFGCFLCARAQDAAPLQVRLQDCFGLTSASAPDHRLELVPHSKLQMQVRISNTSDQALTLWRPYTSLGDRAIIVELRDPASPAKIRRAWLDWIYTCGMGLPHATTLAAHEDLVVNFNFMTDRDWIFPFRVPKDAVRDLEVRASYWSRNLSDGEIAEYGRYKVARVWEGEVVGNWERIRVVNIFGKAFGHLR